MSNPEHDRLHAVYNAALQHWRETEREYSFARTAILIAASNRTFAWEKLEAAAAALPEEVQRKVAEEQFGPLCQDEGCPQAGTPHVCFDGDPAK